MGKPVAARFRLLDYFKLTSLVAFSLFAVAMFFLERAELTFFEDTQAQQGADFGAAQAELVGAQKQAARASLLLEHEAGHVTLATILANSLWDAHFAPLLAAAQALPPGAASRERIQALPGFARADAAVQAMMKGSSVFKIKVYDTRGLTLYSSEHAQIGQDKSGNAGWKSALAGKSASQLTHRDRFGAFEGVVYDRDLIESYVPVVRAGAESVSGVFEIYSDVTPLLQHLDAVSADIGALADANRAKVERAAGRSRDKVSQNSNLHFFLLAALLAALYAALYVLVRNGQRIIDEQAEAHEEAARREHQWHREKMAALATMAAHASHEIGNPLAVICGLAEDLERAHAAGEPVKGHADEIAAQARRIAGMTRRITTFASARSEVAEPVDVNELVRAVRDFLSFDTRYRRTKIDAQLVEPLPACVGVPDHLNEVLMNLMQAYAEACMQAGATVGIRTEARTHEVAIRIDCAGAAAAGACAATSDWRVASARERVQAMGGRFGLAGNATEILLPLSAAIRR